MSVVMGPTFLSRRPRTPRGLRFYGFLEAQDEALSAFMTGPSGALVPPRSPVRQDENAIRLRFSVVDWHDFAAMRARIAPIPLIGAGREQREARRAALNEMFARIDLSGVDLFISPSEPWSGALLEAMRLGGWYLLGLKRRPAGGDPPALLGNADLGGGDQALWLSVLARPDPESLARLTDIFSLAHVADLGREEDPDGDPEPTPLPPSPLDELRVRIICRKVVEEEQVEQDVYAYDYDHDVVAQAEAARLLLAGY
ncbi:hypothetical protein [Caulobacter sp. UNC279MFTsu5.1]|uniref:hypothetical protein n=1 Tax=Caulobacter sp. UNC279MFTsu5.1 TaxID=1502775 RepID=UPI00036A6A7F|nr:hypothetical protein [Caulobacter sp. UNC279MFTsu5.1]